MDKLIMFGTWLLLIIEVLRVLSVISMLSQTKFALKNEFPDGGFGGVNHRRKSYLDRQENNLSAEVTAHCVILIVISSFIFYMW